MNLSRARSISLYFVLMIMFGLLTITCLTAPSTSTESETDKNLNGNTGGLPNVMSNEEMQKIYEQATGKPIPSKSREMNDAGVLSPPEASGLSEEDLEASALEMKAKKRKEELEKKKKNKSNKKKSAKVSLQL